MAHYYPTRSRRLVKAQRRGALVGGALLVGAVVAMLALSGSPSSPPPDRAGEGSSRPSSTVTAAVTRGPAPNLAGPWHLVFDSKFNSPALNTSQWSTGFFGSGITRGDNSYEQECYDPAQVTMTGSALDLTAIAKTETCDGRKEPYASGMVMSYGKFDFTYGYLEARIWLPKGPRGIADWPAFWAVGQNWPSDGEIDVLEGLGGRACVHFITHRGGNPGSCVGWDLTEGWHTFAADWEPGVITFYYDGVKVFRDTSGVTSAPMYLVLNLALATEITSPDTAPATMKVQYVKVWQH